VNTGICGRGHKQLRHLGGIAGLRRKSTVSC
jgi:hypothetical protein